MKPGDGRRGAISPWVELAPHTPGYPTEYSLARRQVWVRQTNRSGTIVVRYDPRDRRIASTNGTGRCCHLPETIGRLRA